MEQSDYDALAPDPEDWPNGATHFVINPDGRAEWLFGVSPGKTVLPNGNQWSKRNSWASEAHDYIDLPLGIDWRLCIWQRPTEAG